MTTPAPERPEWQTLALDNMRQFNLSDGETDTTLLAIAVQVRRQALVEAAGAACPRCRSGQKAVRPQGWSVYTHANKLGVPMLCEADLIHQLIFALGQVTA